MGDIKSKARFLKVKEILEKETDDDHKLTLKEIISKLENEFGPTFKVEKKAILDDIQSLKDNQFYIVEDHGMHNATLYCHPNKIFDIYELRVLIDAVSSARFISKNETKKLIEKIKGLTSKPLQKRLENSIHIDEKVKCTDNKIKYYLDAIHRAISEQKKLSFQYGSYTTDKEFKLHREGEEYAVIPYELVWSNDYYYLIARDNIHRDVIHYRVDRMRNVKVTKESFEVRDFNVDDHLRKTFNMYSGVEDIVEIEFDNHLINVVIDRFGCDIDIKKTDDKTFKIRIHAAISKGLVRRILTWGSDAKVLSPQYLVNEIKAEGRRILDMYE